MARAGDRVAELKERIATLEAESAAHFDELWALREEPTRWVTRRCVEELGLEVRTGPLSGLRYPPELVERVDALAPKLAGSYERELRHAIRSIVASSPARVLEVGTADGYYGVGLARALPTTEVGVFELDVGRREVAAQVAAANDAGHRVAIEPRCGPDEIAALARGDCLILDCGGNEVDLLGAAELTGVTALVELHDGVDAAATGFVTRRFSATHDIELIEDDPGEVHDFPELSFLNRKNRQLAIWEFRTRHKRWAWLRPKGAA